MDISKAITTARPGASWSLNGESLDGLTWIGPGSPPTMEELTIAWQNHQAQQEAENTERQTVRNLITALRDGTGTTATRLSRVEKCTAYLLRNLL